jgi:hypothetical protein
MFYEMDRNFYRADPTDGIAGHNSIIVAGDGVVSLVIAHPLGSPLGDPGAPIAIRSDDFDDIIVAS